MSRRAFLAQLLLCAAAWLGCRRVRGSDAFPGDPLAAALFDTLEAPDAAAEVGDAYLAVAPEATDRARLVAGLCDSWTAEERSAVGDPLALRLARQHRDDLLARRHLRIDGWVVSQTEARLGALAALAR